MKNPLSKFRSTFRSRPHGLGLIELMISLAISSMLLIAVATAFSASASVVENNDRFSRATQSARISLYRLLSQIRTGSVDESSSATQLTLITTLADGSIAEQVTYQYLRDAQQLVMIRANDPALHPYVLARNVTDMQFNIDLGQDYNKAPCVTRVTIAITTTIGTNTIRLSGSASPRMNLIY